jgi:hypothetical protein
LSRVAVLPATQCKANSSRTHERCKSWTIRGADVCYHHGGAAPQVKAAAAARVTLAEEVARAPRRHPLEVQDSALHTVDVVGRQLMERLSSGAEIRVEDIQTLIETARTQAGLAKLVLDSNRGDWGAWTAREVIRQQGEALANICRAFAEHLGHDPDSDEVQVALSSAVGQVVYGKAPVVRATAQIEGRRGDA